MFRKILDNTDPGSLANKFRRKRFLLFTEFIKDLERPVKILDIGGTENFWKQMGIYGNNDYLITILNLDEPDKTIDRNFEFVKGDAIDLRHYNDKSFDVVFSNSVIEHIEIIEDRQKMANEIMRIGKRFFVQTPNYYFPFEPHFLLPFFQYLPKFIKIWLLLHFDIGWFKKCSSKAEALKLLNSNRLLTIKELRTYFTNCKIIKEKYLIFTKSLIAAG